MKSNDAFLKENRQRIEEAYEKRIGTQKALYGELGEYFSGCEDKTVLALKYLYANMPYSDMGNAPVDVYADYAAHGVFLWEQKEEVRALPEMIFLNYVLYHRVNEEEIRPCRSLFYEQMDGENMTVTGKEAVYQVNYWCAGEVTYHASDDRTLSALSVYQRGNGRCGEESVFCVNAMRSVGIPSRQIYVPKWSHCDDNHAWTEVWCGGEWYFTGACEPEPILNRGWFTNAASRAMMVHSRWFDEKQPDGRIIGKEGMVTMKNELDRYAAVKEITIQVQDTSGTSIPGAQVFFEVINYSEYAPIAECVTGETGSCRLTTGLGSLHIHATDGNRVGECLIDVRNTDYAAVILGKEPDYNCWTEIDMIAPTDVPVHTMQPEKKAAEINRTRKKESGERVRQKIENWNNPERTAFLQNEKEDEHWRKALLSCLSDKDQTDCRADSLEEHLQAALQCLAQNRSVQELPEDIFISYVMNPRVEDEILQGYRNEILSVLSKEEQEQMRRQPKEIASWISKRIRECPDGERSSVTASPAACLKIGIGSKRAKKILFAAIARTLGVPAGLNPHDGEPEYWESGSFVPVTLAAEKNCRLILENTTGENWQYFQNWSMARLIHGQYVSLKLNDLRWKQRQLSILLEPGIYRIVTSNRLPNGSIFAKQSMFSLKETEEKTIALEYRHADLSDMLESISLPPFDLQKEDGTEVKVRQLLGQGKRIVMFLSETQEPTEHILNEMRERKEGYASCASHIIVVLQSKEAKEDKNIKDILNSFPEIQVYYKDFSTITEILGRRLYVDHEKLPLIFVTDGPMNAIYATSGYNVGSGDMLLRLME